MVCERYPHVGAAFNNETGRRVAHRFQKALQDELIGLLGVFSYESHTKDDCFTLRVDPAEENNGASESCLNESLVEEYKVGVPLILCLHLWRLVEQIGRALTSQVFFEENSEGVFFTLLLESLA